METQDYRYALSVTSQFYFCGMPFRLDITPKCELNCLYCFAMARGGRKTSNELLINYKSFERKIIKNLESNQPDFDINGEFLRQRQPIHFGGMSDPFSTKQTTEIALKCIRLFNRYNYPLLVSTKNTTVFEQEGVLEVIKMGNNAVQISFSCFDENNAIIIEPNIPSPEERIKVIETLTKEGIHVIARIQPILTIWLKEIEQELIPALGKSGCKHVIAEFLKIPVERKSSMISYFIKALDWDVYNHYKMLNAKLIGREWILPNEKKLELLASLIKATHQWNMTFSCGDYGLNHIGDT
jgi:DNA repair photolyase